MSETKYLFAAVVAAVSSRVFYDYWLAGRGLAWKARAVVHFDRVLTQELEK